MRTDTPLPHGLLWVFKLSYSKPTALFHLIHLLPSFKTKEWWFLAWWTHETYVRKSIHSNSCTRKRAITQGSFPTGEHTLQLTFKWEAHPIGVLFKLLQTTPFELRRMPPVSTAINRFPNYKFQFWNFLKLSNDVDNFKEFQIPAEITPVIGDLSYTYDLYTYPQTFPSVFPMPGRFGRPILTNTRTTPFFI